MNEKGLNEKLGDAQKHINRKSFRGGNGDKCFFSDCNSASIKSHSISESRVLELLQGNVSGNPTIYHLEDCPASDFGEEKTISTYHKTKRKLLKKGKGDTSIFYGFCEKCDGATFKTLDNNIYQNDQVTNFLHSIRTRAHYLTTSKNIFLYIKENTLSSAHQVDNGIEAINQGFKALVTPFERIPDNYLLQWNEVSMLSEKLEEINTVIIKSIREETKISMSNTFAKILDEANFPMLGKDYKSAINGMKDLLGSKLNGYDKKSTTELDTIVTATLEVIEMGISNLTLLYKNKSYDHFNYLHIPIDGVFQIAGAFVYSITEMDECIITFFPEKETGKTHVIFAVTKAHIPYLSKINVMSNPTFQVFISDIILRVGTNVFISPDYYARLSSEVRSALTSDKSDAIRHNINLFDSTYAFK